MSGSQQSTKGAIGRGMPRTGTRRLVMGRGCYLDDVSLKGEVHAAFLRSPYPHAAFRIEGSADAEALRGVVGVFTADQLDPVCQSMRCVSLAYPGMVSPEQRPLARDRAVFQGEPIAMVVAASRALAEDALEQIMVEWEDLPAVTSLEQALDADAPPAHIDLESNLSWRTEIKAGSADKAFTEAALVVREKLTFNRKTAVTLEPRGIIASYDPAEESLLVHMTHQMPHQMQLNIAELLSLSPADVRVVCGDVGGGFGMKMHMYPDELAVCAASRLLGRPVKFVADRIESLVSDTHAREHIIEARMALNGEGRITALEVDDLQGLGAYSVFPRSSTTEAMSMIRAVGGPYRFDNLQVRVRSVLQNKGVIGQYRSVGHPMACAITERLIERAANERRESSLDLRRRNFVSAESQPWISPMGSRMVDLSHHACLDRMVELVDLPALSARIAEMRVAGRVIGFGLASFVEFTASGAAGYGKAGVPVASIDTVVLTVDPKGNITAQSSASELGQGITQGLTQIVADAIGMPIDKVRVKSGDTQAAPHGGGAWSSRGAAITGEAAWGAGQKLRTELLRIAAALLQDTPENLDIVGGRVVDCDSGADRMGIDQIAWTATFKGYELPDGLNPQLTVAHQYGREKDMAVPTNGVQASLVEIDPETGFISLLKHWAVDDCGKVINPLLVEGQIRGGIIQGVGEAIYEACRYDDSGQFVSGTLADYLVPMASEMPDITIAHLETPYSGSVLGAKGAGEAGLCGAPAAILNAVNDALSAKGGATVTELPITPTAVLQALGTAEDLAA